MIPLNKYGLASEQMFCSPASSASPAWAISRQVVEGGCPASFDVEPDKCKVPEFVRQSAMRALWNVQSFSLSAGCRNCMRWQVLD